MCLSDNGVSSASAAELRHRIDFENLVSNLAMRFMSTSFGDMDQALDSALELIGRFTGADRSYLFQFTLDGMRFSNTHEWCAPGIEPQMQNIQEVPAAEFSWHLDQLDRNGLVHIPDVSTLPAEAGPLRQALEAQGVRSTINVALCWGDRLRGLLGFDAVRSRTGWSEGDIALLTTVSSIIASAMERHQSEEGLRLAGSVFASISEAIVVTDSDGVIVEVNPAFTRLTGHSRSSVLGQAPEGLCTEWHHGPQRELIRSRLRDEGQWSGEVWLNRRDGTSFPAWMTISEVRDQATVLTNHVCVFSDISQLKQAQAQLEFRASHDALTGLPHRGLFDDRLEHALHRAERTNSRLAVMYLDLDDFKIVNDGLGHAAGDRILKAVAQRLVAQVRRDDTVARRGGDEFTILLEDDPDTKDVALVADKLLQAFSGPFSIAGAEQSIGMSIGISVYPQDGGTPDELLLAADSAMYLAKAGGGHQYQFHTQEQTTTAFERLLLETQLQRALDEREFILYFQPVYELATERIAGMEAVLRWRHPDLGVVGPQMFLPQAEDSGLVVPIGGWVLQEAMGQMRRWRTQGVYSGPVSINLSGTQLEDPSLIESVALSLDEAGIGSADVALEIPGAVVLDVSGDTGTRLHALHTLGLSLVVDGIGSGPLSPCQLARHPYAGVKVHPALIHGITIDPNSVRVLRALVSLIHSLGLQVVAEGVETADQHRIVAEAGCDLVQGFLYQRPVPAAELEQVMAEQGVSPFPG